MELSTALIKATALDHPWAFFTSEGLFVFAGWAQAALQPFAAAFALELEVMLEAPADVLIEVLIHA